MLLNSLNSCVNPWIYLFFNRNLVQALKQQVCRCQTDKAAEGAHLRGGTGAVLPEMTTQGTDLNTSRQSSPVYPVHPRKFDMVDVRVHS